MMEGIEIVVKLMAIAAKTAPKTRGDDSILTKILLEDELKPLAESMIQYGERTGKKNFDRDGRNVLKSGAVLLIGIKDGVTCGLDCGACGFPDCNTLMNQKPCEGEFRGPACAFRLLDMGIALGSAVKAASDLNVDNRIMYRIGAVARDMRLVDWDFVMGIPLSVNAKNIYFDRK